MLVLTRRLSEAVMVVLPEGTTLPDGTVLSGPDCLITISVLALKGGNVRLGIDVCRALPVHREEVYRRVAAGLISPPPLA